MQNEIPSPRDSGIQYAQNSGSRARYLHLPHGFYIYVRTDFAFAARLFNEGAGDPSQPPYTFPCRQKECSPKLLENN